MASEPPSMVRLRESLLPPSNAEEIAEIARGQEGRVDIPNLPEGFLGKAASAVGTVVDASSNATQGLVQEGPVGAWRGLTQQENYEFIADDEGTTTLPVIYGNPMIEPFLGMEEEPPVPSASMQEIPNKWINDVLETFIDPGLGLAGAAYKRGKALITALGVEKGFDKGAIISGLSDYLDKWYGPGQELPSLSEAFMMYVKDPSGINRKTVDWRGKPKGPNPPQFEPEIVTKRKYVGAATNLGRDWIRGVLDRLSPTARAGYTQHKVSRNSQRLVEKMLRRHEGPVPVLAGGGKRAPADQFKPNLDYPIPFLRQPRFDRLWDNEKWRRHYLKSKQEDYNRAIEEGTAQMIYNGYVAPQAGTKIADLSPALREMQERTMLEPPTPYEPGIIMSMLREHAGDVETGGFEYVRKANGEFRVYPETIGKTDTPHPKAGKRIRNPKTKRHEMNIDEAKYLEDYIEGAYPEGMQLVSMKAPSSLGGDHYSDVVYGNPSNGTMSKLFKANWDEYNANGKINMETFQDAWVKAEGKQKGKTNQFRILDFDDDGVWLKGSLIGKSIVEGGVGWVAKYRNDGTLMSVMLDKHDFGENLPVAGAIVGNILSNDLVGMSPAMNSTIFKIKPADFDPLISKATRKTAAEKLPKQRPPTPNADVQYKDLLESFIKERPSEEFVRAEQWRVGGMLTGAGVAGANALEPEK